MGMAKILIRLAMWHSACLMVCPVCNLAVLVLEQVAGLTMLKRLCLQVPSTSSQQSKLHQGLSIFKCTLRPPQLAEMTCI